MADCAFTDMSDSSFDGTKTIRAPTLERHKILNMDIRRIEAMGVVLPCSSVSSFIVLESCSGRFSVLYQRQLVHCTLHDL